LNAVPTEGDMMGAAISAADLKYCSIDDAECESCQ
jgi:hypothetical protein